MEQITSAALQRLIGVNKSVLNDLATRGIAKRGEKRGSYKLESVTRYCEHLRTIAAGRGGEAGASARERLGLRRPCLPKPKRNSLPVY